MKVNEKKMRQTKIKSKKNENSEDRKKRFRSIIKLLRREFPEASCALIHHHPLQLMVATILSAQCTDQRVNMVTPVLFKKFSTARDFANAKIEEVEQIIHSTGFYHAKAKNLIACCKMIVEKFRGVLPQTMEELITLPGVGRKTANVVLGSAFGIPGFPVDTHVRRITNLLHLTQSFDPDVIEQEVTQLIHKKDWTEASHLLILHGRKTCMARRPKCEECIIAQYCPSSKIRNF